MWKDQRRRRTQHSRLFIISSRRTALAVILYIIDVYILYYLEIELQVSRQSPQSVLEYLIEHGLKLCASR